MSAASSPNPQNLLLLGVLGIGAYYVMTRRAGAAPVYMPQPGAGQSNTLGQLGGLLGGLFRGGASNLMGTYDGRAQLPWDVTPAGSSFTANNPSAWLSGGQDGMAYNPVGSAPLDSIWGGGDNFGGFGSALYG